MDTHDTNPVHVNSSVIAALIDQAKSGRHSIFIQLMDYVLADVWKTAYLLSANPAAAEHLAVETCLYAWKKIITYDEAIPFVNWMQQIVFRLYTQTEKEIKAIKPGQEIHPEKLNSVEKVFFEFDSNERLTLVLFDNLLLPIEEITKTMGLVNVEDAAKTICACKLKLLASTGISIPGDITDQTMLRLIEISRKAVTGDEDKRFVSDNQLEFLRTGFEIVNDSLMDDIALPGNIITTLKEQMFDSISEKQIKTQKKDAVGKPHDKSANTGALPHVKSKKAPGKDSLRHSQSNLHNASESLKKLRPIRIPKSVFVGAGVLVLAAVLYYFIIYEHPTGSIKVYRGTYSINSINLSQNRISEGDVVQNGSGSYLKIQYYQLGMLELYDRAVLSVQKLEPGRVFLHLQSGVLYGYFLPPVKSFGINDPPIIEIQTGLGILSSVHAAFQINQQPSGIYIECFKGIIKFKLNSGKEFVLGGGYSMKLTGLEEVIPVHKDASAEIKKLAIPGHIESLSDGQMKNDLQFAETRDLLMLWHLLWRVNEPKREIIYDRINKLSFIPFADIKMKAVKLEPETCNRLLNLISVSFL